MLFAPVAHILFPALLVLTALRVCAQEASEEFETVTVVGKADDLLRVAPAASKGQASSEEFLSRPVLRRGEILESIPGVIVTQHAGGGKANQYFLRGYNLDHGTDFATSLDGMPLNMRTHAHGQGYTDLNGVIPELVKRLDYVKGTYTAANGDLSTAGSANFLLFKHLERNQATLEIGDDHYYRGLIAGSIRLDSPVAPADGVAASAMNAGKNPQQVAAVDPGVMASLTYALEFNTYDGPWVLPEDFERWNGLLRYFKGDEENWFTATLMGYHGEWNSSDQIPERAAQDGRIDRFGTVDPTTGGHSQRYSLNLAFQTTDGDVVTTGNVYGIYYDLNLYSNSTYFLDTPDRGDQFQQKEERWVIGGNLARTWQNQVFFGTPADYTVGLQTRHDLIGPIGLYRTEAPRRFATVREDEVYESSYSVYADSTARWTDWFRTNISVRGDEFYFDTSQSTLNANEGSEWDGIVSPKFSAIFGPWKETELYLNYGMGFHSNDARGVSTVIDPGTGDRVDKVNPLVRTMGAEIGLRTQVVPDLTSTLALFWLESDSELVYIGDIGANEPGPGSRRYGIEFANYWRPVSWFSLDAELAVTHARFTDSGNDDYIPGSVPMMFSGGVTLGAHPGDEGFYGTLRARAFEKRPLIEDNTVRSNSSFLVNASVGYRSQSWEAVVECLNLFDRNDNDIEYYYTSRLPGERLEGYDDVHLHPTEPRTFRLRVTYRF